MLSCPKCNTSLPEGMRFCLQCGAPLAAAAPTGTSAAGASPPFDSPPVSPAAPPAPAPAGPSLSRPQAAPARLAEDLPFTRAAPSPEPTISLKIAPSVVIAPRVDAPLDRPRPKQGLEVAEVDEEYLRRAFERPAVQPGTVVCRFCKGPLHLEGEYCEQCGAPVEDAAPPGVLKPKPQPAAPAASPPATAPAPVSAMAQPAPSVGSPVASPPARPPIAPPPAPVLLAAPVASPPAPAPAPASAMAQPAPSAGLPVASPPACPPIAPPPAPALPAAKAGPMRRPPLRTRAPLASRPPKPKLAATEPPPGLMGRLKGLLKTKKVTFPVRLP